MEIPSSDIAGNKIDQPRSKYGKLGGWLSIIINVFLFLVKGSIGFMVGSLALIADAFHTLSDLGTSFIVLFSFHVSEKPSDERHPFGHGRAELISAIVMATLLAVTAIELLKYSVDRIINPVPFVAPWWVIGLVFLTVLIKEALAFFTMGLSKKIDSETLKADAMHHHQDAISSMLVVFAFIFSNFNFPYLDGPAGVLISLIILYSAYEIAKSPIDHLLGVRPSESLLSKIEETTLSHPEILGVHDIIIHQYGGTKVISFHIEVEENLSLVHSHRLSELVDKELRKKLGAYITVHVDPVMPRTPMYQKIENTIAQFCRNNPDCDSFHDLRVYGEKPNLRVLIDLVSAANSQKSSDKELIESCKNYLQKNVREIYEIMIKVEPKFSITRRSRHN